jgi:hypothetical protein
LQCSPNGLTYRKRRYGWNQILSVRLNAGNLVITVKEADRSKDLRIPTKKIANPDLCAQLINNIEY